MLKVEVSQPTRPIVKPVLATTNWACIIKHGSYRYGLFWFKLCPVLGALSLQFADIDAFFESLKCGILSLGHVLFVPDTILLEVVNGVFRFNLRT